MDDINREDIDLFANTIIGALDFLSKTNSIENTPLPETIDISNFKEFISTMDDENMLCDSDKCSICKGKCCKTCGCHISPDDLEKITIEHLEKILNSGFVSIDWWEGNPVDNTDKNYRGYYLRMRNQSSKIVDPCWGGVCNILTEEGCPLLFSNRPKGGRQLVPTKDNIESCKALYTKQQCAIDWMPYHDILEQLKNKYE